MSKYLFNGVILPEIPADVLAEYPYAWIRNNGSTGYYDLIFSKLQPYLYSDGVSIAFGNGTSADVVWYRIEIATAITTSEWVYNSTSNTWFGLDNERTILWSSCDIPNGSVTATNIYFEGSEPQKLTIYLTNKTQLSSNGTTSCTVTMSGCTPGNMLVLAYAVRGNGNDPILSDGWVKLGGGNNVSDSSAISSDGIDQRLYFAYKIVSQSTETVTITQTVTSRIYTVMSEYFGAKVIKMRNDLAAIGTTNYEVLGKKTKSDDIMVYGVTSTYYGSGRAQTVTPSDLVKIEGDSSAERLACWFDGGFGAIEHTFRAYNSSEARDAVLECVQLEEVREEYPSNGEAEFKLPSTASITNYCDSFLEWEANTPDGTDCKVYFKKDNDNYIECKNKEKLPGLNSGEDLSKSELYIKVVLFTEDVLQTPNFNSLSVSIRDNSYANILLFELPKGNVGSIKNAVDKVEISYAGGTLSGVGGPVEDFNIDFMPQNLSPINHPHFTEHIEFSMSAKGVLTKVDYTNTYHNEHIDVSIVPSGTLIHIEDI